MAATSAFMRAFRKRRFASVVEPERDWRRRSRSPCRRRDAVGALRRPPVQLDGQPPERHRDAWSYTGAGRTGTTWLRSSCSTASSRRSRFRTAGNVRDDFDGGRRDAIVHRNGPRSTSTSRQRRAQRRQSTAIVLRFFEVSMVKRFIIIAALCAASPAAHAQSALEWAAQGMGPTRARIVTG